MHSSRHTATEESADVAAGTRVFGVGFTPRFFAAQTKFQASADDFGMPCTTQFPGVQVALRKSAVRSKYVVDKNRM